MRRTVLGPALLGLCTLALYLPRVDSAPAELYRDEAFHAVSAHALATTGRDLNGRRLPLIIAPDPGTSMLEAGAPPVLVYAMAAVFTVLPVSEASTRLPMILIGVLDVLLVYAVGRLLFERVLLAELAAALLALTPTHFLFSRLALAAQAPVPFVLGWLLCVLWYLRRGDARLLCLAGALLVAACAAYFAVLVLLPFFVLLTAAVMYWRRSPASHFVSFAAGIVVPVLVCVPWLLWDSHELQRILTHYDWRDPRRGGAIADAVSLYRTFWGPRFLFIDGAPRIEFSTRVAGIFLLSTAGVMLIGFFQGARRLSPNVLLVLAAFVSAPVPASLVGEGQAIWRALPIIPFGALIAVLGIRRFWTTDSDREQRISLIVTLGSLVALTAVYHYDLPFAQALLRASLVPLVAISLSLVLRTIDLRQGRLIGIAGVGFVTLLAVQFGLFAVDYSVVIRGAPWLAAVLCGIILLPDTWLRRLRLNASGGVALLAIVASVFAYFHIERITLPRLPLVPAGAVLPLARFAAAGAAVAAALALALRGRVIQRPRAEPRTTAAIAGLVFVQVAYWHVDWFSDDRARLVHVAVVLLATVGLVMWLREHLDRPRLAAVATSAIMTLAVVQFAYFYVEYMARYQPAFPHAGSARAALERVIEHVRERPAPVVYFWNFGHHGVDTWYWTFYLAKHHQEDVAGRTVRGDESVDAAVERIRGLPPGSLIVTRPSNDLDRTIERMRDAGYVQEPDIVRNASGRPAFWILERHEP